MPCLTVWAALHELRIGYLTINPSAQPSFIMSTQGFVDGTALVLTCLIHVFRFNSCMYLWTKKAVKQWQNTDHKTVSSVFRAQRLSGFCMEKIKLYLENSLCFGSNCLYQTVLRQSKRNAPVFLLNQLFPTKETNPNTQIECFNIYNNMLILTDIYSKYKYFLTIEVFTVTFYHFNTTLLKTKNIFFTEITDPNF